MNFFVLHQTKQDQLMQRIQRILTPMPPFMANIFYLVNLQVNNLDIRGQKEVKSCLLYSPHLFP